MTLEEKEQAREKKHRIKDKQEEKRMGDMYEMLYPLKKGVSEEDDMKMQRYEELLVKSKEIWEESIAGGGYAKKKEKEETNDKQHADNQKQTGSKKESSTLTAMSASTNPTSAKPSSS